MNAINLENNEIIQAVFFVLLAFISMFLVLILFFYFSRKKIVQIEVDKKNLEIEHQKELLNSVLITQEEERKRIAQDLHDDISSKLNVVSLNSHLLKTPNLNETEQLEITNNIIELTQKALENSRRIAHDLLPPVLEKFGLHAGIEELVEEFNSTKTVTVSYKNQIDFESYPVEKHLHIFRILQELLNNSLRHGKATEISIQFTIFDNRKTCTYSDNGLGFDSSSEENQKGLGMKNIESRINFLGGDFNFTSKPNEADDEELFRKGIYFLLQREPNFEIIFEASNGSELVEHLKNATELPDIIMMDLKMPLLNGVEATKLIHKDFPGIRIIALTSYNTKSFIANMINVGAASYLVKNASPVDMIKTVNEVAQKGFYYNEIVMEVIHQNMISNATSRTVLDEDFLTEREKEVLELICKQYSSAEIGEMLSLSTRTVDGHRNNLLLKTNSKNMAGLVIFAIQNKIINLEDSNTDIES